jgi:hypothetical protein
MSDNKIVTRNKVTIGGGLHSRIKSQELLKELEPKTDVRNFPNRLVLICDFSGSMDSPANREGYMSGNNKSKLALLSEGVQDFALKSDTSSTALAVESFPQGFRIDLTNDTNEVYMRMLSPRTIGDTPMGEGLANALQHHSPTRAMLISDGDQTDGDRAFVEARIYRERGIVVDCFHIGDSTRGEETLKQIAEITDGMYFKFKDVGAFSASLYNLLPGHREALAQLPADIRSGRMGADYSE